MRVGELGSMREVIYCTVLYIEDVRSCKGDLGWRNGVSSYPFHSFLSLLIFFFIPRFPLPRAPLLFAKKTLLPAFTYFSTP